MHWTCATPRPNDDERTPFIDADEFDRALRAAEQLMQVTTLPENPYGRAIAAIAREHQLKRWSRDKKEALIRGDRNALDWLSHRSATAMGHAQGVVLAPTAVAMARARVPWSSTPIARAK